MPEAIKFSLRFEEQIDRALDLYERYVRAFERRRTLVVTGGQIHIHLQQGEDMSYTVPRDHQDEPFTLDPIVISDSEGPVDKAFTETFESDNTDVVSIDGSNLHFGTFGGANLTRKVTIDGQEFIVATAVFNVTPGTLTVTGNINVPGLTPDPAP